METKKTTAAGFASTHEERNSVSKHYFEFNSCGFLRADALIVSRRAPRQDYMMIFVTGGTVGVLLDGKYHNAVSGDLIYMESGKRLDYDFRENSQHYWMHFSGYDVGCILADGGITGSGIFKIGHCAEIGDLFFQITCALSFPSANQRALCMSCFCKLLSICAESRVPEQEASANIGLRGKLNPALKHMNANYNERHKLDFYADLCHLSLSQFKHAFVRMTRIPPSTYLNTIRIEAAKKLMAQSDKEVMEISALVGFDDPFYFSRFFKKKCGMSPRDYIKANRTPE